MDTGKEEKEIMSSSREVILKLIASGEIDEKKVKLTEEEKELIEKYKKTYEIIKENEIEINISTPID